MVEVFVIPEGEAGKYDTLYNRYQPEIHAPKKDLEHPMFRRPERKSLDRVVVGGTEHELHTREDLMLRNPASSAEAQDSPDVTRMRQVRP